MKSDIHLQLHDSRIKRIHILKSAKYLTETLRTFSSLKKLRENKMKKQQLLEDCLSQISIAFNELKVKDIPMIKASLRGEEQKVENILPLKEKNVVVQPPRIDKKEIELIQQLDDIEKKLASLT